MNKAQEKAYKEYLESTPENPMDKENWIAVEEQREAEEKQAYLDYQIRAGKNQIEILTKEIWIQKGKPTGESKAEKFIRLVEPRTNKALDAIQKLESLTSPNYESTPELRAQVLEAIKAKVAELEATFAGKKETKTSFKITV